MGVRCYDASHLVALVVSAAFLLVFAVAGPLALLRMIHHSVYRRRVSLKLRKVRRASLHTTIRPLSTSFAGRSGATAAEVAMWPNPR